MEPAGLAESPARAAPVEWAARAVPVVPPAQLAVAAPVAAVDKALAGPGGLVA